MDAMIGLLWQRDHDDEPLETTLTRACRRYAARFDRWPTLALVPEGTPAEGVVLTLGSTEYVLEVRPSRRVPPGHVLVGIEGYDPSAPPVVRPTEEPAPAAEPAEESASLEPAEAPEPASLREELEETPPARVKRRSTMGQEPSTSSAANPEAPSRPRTQQLSLWRKLKGEERGA